MKHYEQIPLELKQLPNWCNFKLITKSGRTTKIPYQSLNGEKAKSNDATTWTSYEQALDAVHTGNYDGIGFFFSPPYFGVDIDHVDTFPPGTVEEFQQGLGTYWEYSPSGTGVHFICKGQLPPGRRRKGQVEMYDNARYFTMTGNTPCALPVLDCSQRILPLFEKYLGGSEEEVPPSAKKTALEELSSLCPLTDTQVLEKASRGQSGEKFKMLFQGDWEALGYPSHSEADLALCSMLAFWCGNDVSQIHRIFCDSGLYREDWQRKSQYTLKKAVETGHKVYEPAQMSHTQVAPLPVEPKNTVEDYRKRHSVKENIPAFIQGIVDSRKNSVVSTGFQSLDTMLDGGLYEGLYVIGAISSLGKTTFSLQIADNLAKAGQDVLYFSLEMAKAELMAKSISRETAQQEGMEGKSAREILDGARWSHYQEEETKMLERAIRTYEAYGAHLFLFDEMEELTVEGISKAVAQHETLTGNRPVVIVDYLQILAPADARASDKQNMDKAVLALKRMSRSYHIPVLAISSFNRDNYTQGVHMASFKESGAIEYSSDVLIGLQYQGMGEKHRKNVLEETAMQAQAGTPVKVELKVLKNRNGVKGQALFEFYGRYNLFRELWEEGGREEEGI